MKRSEILATATELINGDRAQQYGDAKTTHQAIEDIVNILYTIQQEEVTAGRSKGFPPATAAYVFQIATKMVRAARSPRKLDTWIDIAGYAALAGEAVSDE